MSPVAREISLCYALLLNFVAAGANRVSGDGVRRSLLAAGSARHMASSAHRRSEGNSQRGSWTVAFQTPSGFALPRGRVARASSIRGPQSLFAQTIHRLRPSCSRWAMSTAVSTQSCEKGSMASEDSNGTGSTQSSAIEKQADMKITLLSGFLGAGKTTLMRNIIRQARKEELSLALIVNDMADVNIDAQMLFRGKDGPEAGAMRDGVRSVADAAEGETAVAMQGGCICCTLREDLIAEVEGFTREGRHKHLLIESTGISDPTPVAEALATSVLNIDFDESGEVDAVGLSTEDTHTGGLGRSFSLDTLVTVVDSTSFLEEVRKADDIEDRGLEAMEGDTRTIADLLVSQVEFSNVILLNKADLTTAEELDKVEGFVRLLNPTADIKRTVSSEVGLAEIMGTGQFDFDVLSQSAGWVQQASNEVSPNVPGAESEASGVVSTRTRGESRGDRDDGVQAHGGGKYGTDSGRGSIGARAKRHDDHTEHDHRHTETFGIESFTFRAERPFHPERLMEFVMNHLPSVLRSKGFFWLATRKDSAGLWNHAGGSFASEDGGRWLNEDVGEKADPVRGVDPSKSAQGEGMAYSRRNELVFIGLGLDQQGLTSALRECLLTDEEMSAGSATWADLTDPFPPWNYDEEDGIEEYNEGEGIEEYEEEGVKK